MSCDSQKRLKIQKKRLENSWISKSVNAGEERKKEAENGDNITILWIMQVRKDRHFPENKQNIIV